MSIWEICEEQEVPVAEDLFDTHCHLFEHGFNGRRRAPSERAGSELAEYEGFRDEYGISRSLVIGYDEGDYSGNSDYLDRLAVTRDWLTPLRYHRSDEAPTRATSVYPSSQDQAMQLADNLRQAVQMGKAPSIVSLNARPDALAPLREPIRDLKETWFLVSHLGLPGPVSGSTEARQRLKPLLALAGLGHVSVKISGQYAASLLEYPHEDVNVLVDMLATTFGVDALVWGSDFPACSNRISFDEALNCQMPTGISASERRAILSVNAHRMYDKFSGHAQ